jgi:hypothetical protein
MPLSRQEVEERLRNLTPNQARLNLACLSGEGAQHVLSSLTPEDASLTLKSLTRLGALNTLAGISDDAAHMIMANLSPRMASLTLATTPAVCCSCGRATPALTITEATPEEPRAEAETDEEEEEAMHRDGAGLYPAESLVSFFFKLFL